jgi:hypothetical protein
VPGMGPPQNPSWPNSNDDTNAAYATIGDVSA